MPKRFSYSQLMDEETMNVGFALGQASDDVLWSIGELVLRRYQQLVDDGKKVDIVDVCRAVGVLTGYRSQQVIPMATAAHMFNQETRQKYELLSFAHFVRALQYGNWQEALDWCMDQVDELGRPASVDAMNVMFKPNLKRKYDDPTIPGQPAAVGAAIRTTRRKARRSLRLILQDLERGKLDIEGDAEERIKKLIEGIIEKLT